MSVFERITKEMRSGMVLYTPVRRKQFIVDSIDAEKLVFRVGTKTPIRIPKVCWDDIPNFLRGRGWVEIRPKHDVAPRGSFGEYLDTFWEEGKTHASAAEYVVPVLEHLGIVEVDHSAPSKVRLK